MLILDILEYLAEKWRALKAFNHRYFEEPTYCGGCKRFSRGNYCPYCKY